MSTPAVLGCAAAALLLALPVVAAASTLETRHRLDGAADAAALAAADAASGWIDAEPCELARRVLETAGARFEECRLDDDTGRVRIRASAGTMLGTTHARAHAGPSLP